MRPLALILCAMVFILARGYDHWYVEPRSVSPGITVMGSDNDATVAGISMQVRALPKNARSSWGLIWDMTDSLSFTRARLTPPPQEWYDDNFGACYGIVVERVDSGRTQVLHRSEPGSAKGLGHDWNTVKIIGDDPSSGTVRLYAGSKDLEYIGDFSLGSGEFALWADGKKGLKVQRMCLELDTVPRPALSKLYAETGDSCLFDTASAVGRWEFLDRDIRGQRISIGGKYRLAVAGNPDDGYDIVYVSGAEVNRDLWKEGCIKGRLIPTAFQGDYDLVWFDALGRRRDGEQSATLSADGNLLQLNFPLAKAVVRFRRIPCFRR